MLVDVFSEMLWEPVNEQVPLYKITTRGESLGRTFLPEKKQAECRGIELLFCLEGSFCLKYGKDMCLEIGRDNIIIMSNAAFTSITVREAVLAYSLVLDEENFGSFLNIYNALGCKSLSFQQAQGLVEHQGGCIVLKHCFWSQSFFTILHSVPADEQGRYCALKAAELLYLLNTHQEFSADMFRPAAMAAYFIQTMHSIGSYIENHLDEKLTISEISRSFNLSPTTLKNKFREFYGQPIHSWILSRRIRRAAEMLRFTDMTVLQIAQSVGYESTSQFNVAFKNTFGVSPSVFRKNVQNSKNLTDSV